MNFVPTYKGKALAVWLSAAALIVCLLLSWVFAHERILNTDNSAFFFNLVNTESVSVAEQRYSAGLPQFPAWLAIKLGASLNAILHVFSMSYTALYLLIFCLIVFVCKNQQAAVALALGLLLGVFHSFFHPVTETHQAIAWAVLCHAFLGSNLAPISKGIGLSISFSLALFAHPAAVFLLAFICLWNAIGKPILEAKWQYIAIISLAIFAVLRSKLNAQNYDATQYQNLYASLANLPAFFTWNSVTFMSDRPVLYAWPLLLWLIALVQLANNKQWLKAALLLVAPLAILVIAAATFSGGDSQMMMEKAYMPVWTMIAIGAGSILVADGFFGLLSTVFLALFFVATLLHINMAGNKQFKPRLQAIDKMVNNLLPNKQYKVVCLQPGTPQVWRSNWWATAADVLMRSTITTGKSFTLYLAMPDEDLSFAQTKDAFLYAPWWRDRETNILNPRFFSFEPHPYDTINLTDNEY